MPVLSTDAITAARSVNSRDSFGPFVSLDAENYLFDARKHEFPIWLGHQSSAMFGLLQHRETWSGNWTDEMQRVKNAYLDLAQRRQNSLGNELDSKPLQLANCNDALVESLTPAQMLYRYISLSIIDQYSSQFREVTETIQREFEKLMNDQDDRLSDPFIDAANLEFGFSCVDVTMAKRLRSTLLNVGILNYPLDRDEASFNVVNKISSIESNRFLFQLSFAFRGPDLDLFWDRLNLAFESIENESVTFEPVPIDRPIDRGPQFEFHTALIEAKALGRLPARFDAISFLSRQLDKYEQNLTPVLLNKQNYSDYRDRILDIQQTTYEPVRRSPPAEFDMLFDSENPLAIMLLDKEEVAAMVFAGQLRLFTQERGVSSDPFLDDPSVYYSMDLTVSPKFRGGMGQIMKQAQLLLAIENGVSAIHGRNRDRLAAGMWAINLSMGSYELQHLHDDYQDDEPHRDCIYYRCPLKWSPVARKEFEKFDFARMLEGCDLNKIFIP